MGTQKISLSIIFPVFNEADNIETTVVNTLNFLLQEKFWGDYEIIVVDDGSTDDSQQILYKLSQENHGVTVLKHNKNRGYGGALVTGIKRAQYSWILLMDADGQFHIKSLLAMLPFMNDFDILAGYRLKRTDSLMRILLGKAYTNLALLLFQVKLKDINCGFKLFKNGVINIDEVSSHGGAFYTDFFIKTQKKGCHIKQIPVEHFPRLSGKQTGASLKVIGAAMIDVFRLYFLDR